MEKTLNLNKILEFYNLIYIVFKISQNQNKIKNNNNNIIKIFHYK